MRTTNVWMEGLPFENDRQSGVWRACSQVLSRRPSDIEITLWLRSPAVRDTAGATRIYRDSGRVTRGRYGSARVRRHISDLFPPRGASQCDVFHCTHFHEPPHGPKIVVSVYDMIFENRFDLIGPLAKPVIEDKRKAIERADVCLCISQATADDVVAFYPEARSKVVVAHLGGDHLLAAKPPERPEAPQDYVLFVGHRGAYKNFRLLLDCLASPDWPADLQLRVTGPALDAAEQLLIKKMGVADKIRSYGFVSESELSALYQNAVCFIFPSLAEGFGLPILEAQTSGCPVVASDIAVFREVAGDGALFFDPKSTPQLIEAVENVRSRPRRQELISKGDENRRRFRWEDYARQTFDVYRALADGA